MMETNIDCDGDNNTTLNEDGHYRVPNSALQQQEATSSRDSTGVKHIWKFYAKESTCHGLKCVVDVRRRSLARTLWLIIVLGMMGVLVNIILCLLNDYYQFPTVTRTDVRIQSQPDFPSVTVCNNSPYKNLNKTTDNPLFVTMIGQSILKYYDGHVIGNISDASIPSIETFMEQSSLEVVETYAFTKDDMIVLAYYEGHALDINKDFETMYTPSGTCFTFNGPEYISKNGVRKSLYDGRSSGLRLLVNVNQSIYVPFERLTAGIRLYMSHHPETPRIEKDGIDVGPGTSASVALHPVQFKFLPKPFESFVSGSCHNIQEGQMLDKMVHARFYSRQACIFQCQIQQASKECGCYSSLLYIKSLPPCTFRKFLDCITPTFVQMKDDLNTSCDCPRPCTFTQYNSVLSTSQLPSKPFEELYAKVLNMSAADELRENFLEVRVFLDSMMLRTESHEPKYTPYSILGFLGGQMGFFMGASLMTIVELGETLFYTAVYLVQRVLSMAQLKRNKH